MDPQENEDQYVELVHVEEEIVAADLALLESEALAAADAVVGGEEHGDH